jgi:hypothetical protein
MIAIGYTTRATGSIAWQTRAYHEESDQRIVLPDISGDALARWMRQQADLPVAALDERPPAVEAAEPPAEAPAAELRLTIQELLLDEVLEAEQAGGPDAAKRLRAQISFQLSGAAAYLATANRSHYDMQILASARSTGQTMILASGRHQLTPESLAYTPTIEFELPPLGHYQLIGTILLPDDATVASAIGPALTVVP